MGMKEKGAILNQPASKVKEAKQQLRPFVFFPAFILLVLTIILNVVNPEAFLKMTTTAKNFMVIDMGWLFSIAGVTSLILVILIYFSPLGKIKLGGEDAKPILKNLLGLLLPCVQQSLREFYFGGQLNLCGI